MNDNDKEKKYLTLEGLVYFLEKFKYALAHNDSNDEGEQKSKE